MGWIEGAETPRQAVTCCRGARPSMSMEGWDVLSSSNSSHVFCARKSVNNRYGSQNGTMAWNLGCNLGDTIYFHQKDVNKEKNDEDRGACKKCGRVGHPTFQCRNFLSVKEDEKDQDLIQVNVLVRLQQIKGRFRKAAAESGEKSSEVDDETESSDSSEDSKMEMIITV